jgi:2-polyprenyl-3-methyl-5-hydroxy-6-metoxy-1,4-benzoquinol methylase
VTGESSKATRSWEAAVAAYRAQPQNHEAVLHNYFDLPVSRAAARYADSEEFAEVARYLERAPGRRLLDFGAGNGIASYAFAKRGWQVTALEPDPSAEVGAGAIRRVAQESGLAIEVCETASSQLPFAAASFDAIHARQVLHHVPSLEQTARELHRVLAPNGLLLSTREHVVSNEEELRLFLDAHPLHQAYGGERAYPRARYEQALHAAGFRIEHVWGPTSSIINYYPGREQDRRRSYRAVARGAGRLLDLLPMLRPIAFRWIDFRDRTPGRLYSFLAVKP